VLHIACTAQPIHFEFRAPRTKARQYGLPSSGLSWGSWGTAKGGPATAALRSSPCLASPTRTSSMAISRTHSTIIHDRLLSRCVSSVRALDCNASDRTIYLPLAVSPLPLSPFPPIYKSGPSSCVPILCESVIVSRVNPQLLPPLSYLTSTQQLQAPDPAPSCQESLPPSTRSPKRPEESALQQTPADLLVFLIPRPEVHTYPAPRMT